MKLIFIPFLAIGAALLAVAGYFFLDVQSFLRSAVSGDGVVIANQRTGSRNRTYYPRVRFQTAGGQQFTFVSPYGSRPPSYHVGDPVRVLYNPEDPKSARIDGFAGLWLLPVIFGILGTVFTSVGGIPLLWMRHVRLRDEWLMANGQRIVAQLDAVELNNSIRVNRKSPYRIVCHWQDPAGNQVHVFRSHNLWQNPKSYVHGSQMIVMVDPANLRRYVVDTSFPPESSH